MPSQKAAPSKLKILSFEEWVKKCGFKTPRETSKYAPYDERRWLQFSIYPMFYRTNWKAYKMYEYPKVIDTDGHYPKYVIDTKYFTIVFLMHIVGNDLNRCWEVSVHIKDHSFCDEKLKGFQEWLFKYYPDLSVCSTSRSDMPDAFSYRNIWYFELDDPMEDFCVSFWDENKDNLLFKLCDTLRLY